MNIEDFKTEVLGKKADSMSQKEIEVYYNTSVGLFNFLFEKWKKEKFSSV